MNKDYIYYLACFSLGIQFFGLFLGNFVSEQTNRWISFALITIPIYGRLFGWW